MASETVVYPRTFDVAGLPPSAIMDAERGDRSEASTLHRGHGGEFWGVREYRPGDPARLVAWKRSARGLPSGKLAVVELAQETHPPFVLALNLDARAPREAREMVVSAGCLAAPVRPRRGQGGQGRRRPENQPFPEEATRDSVLTWCAGLRDSIAAGRGGNERGDTAVHQEPDTTGKPHPSRPGASEARAVVLVSCHAFAGRGPWMSPEEEREFMEKVEASGRSWWRGSGPRSRNPGGSDEAAVASELGPIEAGCAAGTQAAA